MMLGSVCSLIKLQLKDVVNAKIGICAREIELVQVASGRPTNDHRANETNDDRFRLKIPVSDQYMTWEVVFNSSMPNCPPDFDLNDTDFYCSLAVESTVEELLPSLNHWDCRKEKALINVISELRSAYLKYQTHLIEPIDKRCAYEYASLINDRHVAADQIEVYVDNNVIHFLIRLDVNLPIIPPSAAADDYCIVLALKFGAQVNARATNLYTSTNIVDAIGTNLDLQRSIKCDESLSDYVDEIARSVEDQVLTVMMNRQKKRRQFVFELLRRMGQSVVSYDALEFNHAKFLMEDNGFVYILDISLPAMFPSQPPRYRLISAYSTNSESPLAQKIIQFPYLESWDPRTMVDQAINVITNKYVQKFKQFSTDRFLL